MVVGLGLVSPVLSDDWTGRSGQGRWWRGEWKDEFRDGPCQVKVEATRDAYKEEVKCDRNH
jgi:hypothetical protein